MEDQCRELKIHTLSRGKIKLSVMNYGCTITELFFPDRRGKIRDLLCGYDTFQEWKEGSQAHNGLVGRYANRIAGGKFTLDGKEYRLDVNNGKNCLHGGFTRFEKLFWDSECDGESVNFYRTSPSMEQGFPGNMKIHVTYSLGQDNQLIIDYSAQCDAASPVNLTNHAYFNLNGTDCPEISQGKKIIEPVTNHIMQLDCRDILELDKDMIPTGKILPVASTPYDFLREKSVGRDIENIPPEFGGGYDHCFLTGADEGNLVRVGKIRSPLTGISMEMWTNQRGVQIYTGNYLSGIKGKQSVIHNKHDGICFESQRYPDSVNHREFPDVILRPGQKYHSRTIYKFEVEK